MTNIEIFKKYKQGKFDKRGDDNRPECPKKLLHKWWEGLNEAVERSRQMREINGFFRAIAR